MSLELILDLQLSINKNTIQSGNMREKIMQNIFVFKNHVDIINFLNNLI